MGKRLIQQRRGKGSPTYKRTGFRFRSQTRMKQVKEEGSAVIKDLTTCPAHSAPLAELRYEDNTSGYIIAPEGVRTGQRIRFSTREVKIGNITELRKIPEGTAIFNIEAQPGDGGKFVKASGMSARIVAKSKSRITILLPSKKKKDFHPECRACIGAAAGSGRPEKPFYKAGRKYFEMKSKNRLWPSVSGNSMNAVDHPFGGTKSNKKGRPTIAPRNAPPGRKVGMISPKDTGRKKGKKR